MYRNLEKYWFHFLFIAKDRTPQELLGNDTSSVKKLYTNRAQFDFYLVASLATTSLFASSIIRLSGNHQHFSHVHCCMEPYFFHLWCHPTKLRHSVAPRHLFISMYTCKYALAYINIVYSFSVTFTLSAHVSVERCLCASLPVKVKCILTQKFVDCSMTNAH